MKKSLFIFLAVFATALYNDASAQCNPPAVTGTAGLDPGWDSLPCVVRNTPYASVLNIENFTGVGSITVDWLRVDSITNLPAGISYVIRPDNQFNAGETGCIDITGTTSVPCGNYKLGIYVCVKLGILPSPLCDEASALVAQIQPLLPVGTVLPDFSYFARVINAGDNCPYDTISCPVGISDLNNVFSKFQASPNPFTSQTEISFYSATEGKFFANLYDVVGKEVYSSEIEVVNGNNRVVLERGDLSKGAYLYTISNGKESISTRLMIRD